MSLSATKLGSSCAAPRMILPNHATVSAIHLKSLPRSISALGVAPRYWHLSIVCKKEGQIPAFDFVLSFFEGCFLSFSLRVISFIAAKLASSRVCFQNFVFSSLSLVVLCPILFYF